MMPDNKLTCKPSDSEAANKCSSTSSHFDNPSEVRIPPHAPKRKKSSNDSNKEKVDHDSQKSKTDSNPSKSQPNTPKKNPKERAGEKGQSNPVFSGAQHDDNADKASQKLAVYFSEGEHEEKTDQTEKSNSTTPGEAQGQEVDENNQPNPTEPGEEKGQKADETGNSNPSAPREEQGQEADKTGQPNPTAPGEEKGQKADETGNSNPSAPREEQGQEADKTGQPNPIAPGEEKGQKADETGNSNPSASREEQGQEADETGQPNPIAPGEEKGQKADETGNSNPSAPREEQGQEADKPGQPNPTEQEKEQDQNADEKGQSNPTSPGNEQGQKADETGQSFPVFSGEEHGESADEEEQAVPFNSEEEYEENTDETDPSFPVSTEEEYGGNTDETGYPFPIYSGEEYGEGPDETGGLFPAYSGEEYGEGADEARNNSPPPLYNPLGIQTEGQGQSGAPPETKNIFGLTPFVLPAWAEEFKATRCGKSNDSAYHNPSFYRRYYSTEVYFSRCCESGGSHFNGNRPFNESYCNELLRKYREQHVSFTKEGPSEGKKESAPTTTPKPSKTNTVNANNVKKEDEEPGCCKCCCCCECCCKWYSWIIWLILLINVLVLVYIIWWEGCGLVVLKFEDMTDWENYRFLRWAKDILGLDYPMQLFLSFLGYFAYFCVVSCCYIFCKKCTIPDNPKGFCSCKEVKVVIHIIYGAVMIVLLYLEVDYWRNNRYKFKGKEQARLDEEHDCLELCLWFTFAILIIGVIVFVIYSLERRQIRKRIHPETGNTQNEQNRGGVMNSRPYSAVSNGQPGPQGPGNNVIPAAMIVRNVCGETMAPMFQRPMRRVKSFTDCGFSQEMYQASTMCTD